MTTMTSPHSVPPSGDPLAARCRQFALPTADYDDAFAEAIAVSHARALVRLFIDSTGRVLDLWTTGLVELLRGWLDREPGFSTVWHPSLGGLEWALETGDPDPVEIATRLALHLGADGEPGEWSAELCRAQPHHWAGFVLPRSSSIRVTSDGKRARVTFGVNAAQPPVLLDRACDGRWATPHAEALIRVPGADHLVLVPHEAVADQLAIEDEFHSIVSFPPPDEELAAGYGEALRIIARYAPDYLGWVLRVLRGIVPCRCDGSRTRSSSWREAPGTVLMSTAPSPVLVAEMLVHEACHQYFYLVRRLGPVYDQTDEQVYYSPAVDRERRLDRILMAYHAFGNVLCFYRTAMANGLADEACARVEGELRNDVALMERALVGNPSLTALGTALVEPLAERCRG